MPPTRTNRSEADPLAAVDGSAHQPRRPFVCPGRPAAAFFSALAVAFAAFLAPTAPTNAAAAASNASPVAVDWPQWRGPHRDGHAAPGESLPDSLPADLAPRWRLPAGGGFASPIVTRGQVLVADEQDGQETLRALDPDTGTERWRTPYGPVAGDEWGSGPRCTPVADDDRVYVQSMRGSFACLDLATGRRLWGFGFERDYDVQWMGGLDTPDAASRRRGHNGPPVVVGDRIFVAVGATNGATIVGFDKRTGRELWRAGHDETAYAPMQAARFHDRDQVIAFTASALSGYDPADGRLLWQEPLRTHANRHVVTPLVLGPDLDLVVSSHTLGVRRFRVPAPTEPASGASPSAPDTSPTTPPRLQAVWSAPALKTSLATLVHVDGHLYGQGPDRDFLCLDAATGAVKWSQRGFGDKDLVAYASTIAVGKRLLVLTEAGQLILLEARPDRYAERARIQVCGRNWSHPALAGGRLYLRDQRQWSAFDLTSLDGAKR